MKEGANIHWWGLKKGLKGRDSINVIHLESKLALK